MYDVVGFFLACDLKISVRICSGFNCLKRVFDNIFKQLVVFLRGNLPGNGAYFSTELLVLKDAIAYCPNVILENQKYSAL